MEDNATKLKKLDIKIKNMNISILHTRAMSENVDDETSDWLNLEHTNEHSNGNGGKLLQWIIMI